MRNIKFTSIVLLLMFLGSMSMVHSSSHIDEIRYSSQIETDDKFTFSIDIYTDDGNDVETEKNHFGMITSGDDVEITAISDPSSKNIVDSSQSVYFDIWKVVVGGTQISKVGNLGVVSTFILPVLVETSDGDSQNYINQFFKSFNSSISTQENELEIETTDIEYKFSNETLNIDTWNSVYNRRSGVLQEMSIIATSNDNDDLDLQVSLNTGFFANLDYNPTFFFFAVILIPILRRKLKN